MTRQRGSLPLARVLVGILVFALCADAWARKEDPLHRIRRMMQEWRIDEAQAEMRAYNPPKGREAEAHLVQGELRFLQGDYAGGAALMKEAFPSARLPASELAEWRGLQELASATWEATRGFEEVRSPGGHFLIRYEKGRDSLLVPYAAEALERAYEALAEDFAGAVADHPGSDAHKPKTPVRVEIYGQVADLARVSTLTLKEIETSGTIALCKWNRLMIVSPRALARGYPWLDTLTHEYTHFIVSRVSRNSVPIWLHEGLAKFEERRWRGPSGSGMTASMEHVLSLALQKKRFITFEQMYPSMAKLPSQEDTALAFAEVYSMVEYIHGKAGWQGLHKLIARYQEMARENGGREMGGAGDTRAVASALSVSMAELDKGWKTWLKNRKLKTRGGLAATRLKFKKGKAPKPEPRQPRQPRQEEDDSGEIPDPKARNFARLGGLLFAKNRLQPSAMEYEKAQAALSFSHPVIASRLSKIYLELGDPQKAIATAEPILSLYPDLPGPNVTLGTAWLKKGNPAKAAHYLEAANRVNPFDPAIHCGLEVAYRDQKASSTLVSRENQACQALTQ